MAGRRRRGQRQREGGLSPDDSRVKITINIGDRTIAFDKGARLSPSTVIEGESVELTPDVVR